MQPSLAQAQKHRDSQSQCHILFPLPNGVVLPPQCGVCIRNEDKRDPYRSFQGPARYEPWVSTVTFRGGTVTPEARNTST